MNTNINILIIGDGCYHIYEEALCKAFRELGYNTTLFGYEKYLKETKIMPFEFGKIFSYKFQNKFGFGPAVQRLNRDILAYCEENKPDLVFLYRCRAVFPKTIKKIKKMGSIVFSYNNDNPFSEYYPQYFWRHYKKSLPYCDMNYVYRHSNIQECIEYGSRRTDLLRSYYIKECNYPILKEDKIANIPDVIFLGHYENDNRREYLETLASSGIIVGLPGTWEGKIDPGNIVFLDNTGKDYNAILGSAKIALCFLATLNKDTYTRRCFEIPATKTMMLSVYTEDLASLFEPDKEVVYFKNKEELVDKVKYYLSHDEECKKIGQAGYDRLMKDGHEVKDRAKQIIDSYQQFASTK